jgi:hypothetical protein
MKNVFIILILFFGCTYHPNVSILKNTDGNELKANAYLYSERGFPEPCYYIINKIDSVLLYRIILLSKGTKYISFYSDTLKPSNLNGNRCWKGDNIYFYKHINGNYYLNNMKFNYSQNNDKMIHIINEAFLWYIRDSLLIGLGNADYGQSIYNSGKYFLSIDPNDFRDTLYSIIYKKQLSN